MYEQWKQWAGWAASFAGRGPSRGDPEGIRDHPGALCGGRIARAIGHHTAGGLILPGLSTELCQTCGARQQRTPARDVGEGLCEALRIASPDSVW